MAALALPTGWLLALLILWLGPSLWASSVTQTYAVPAFGVAAPIAMTISAVWGLIIRHRDWDAAIRRFLMCLAIFLIIAAGYGFLLGWLRLP